MKVSPGRPLMKAGNPVRSGRWLWWGLTFFVALAGAFLEAREVKIVPEWSVEVLDETGAPVAGFAVDQSWEFFGLSPHAGRDARVTDARGRVVFPAQSFTVSEVEYATGYAASHLNVHASFGPSGTVEIAPLGSKPCAAHYHPNGKIYDYSGAVTTRTLRGFATKFQFQRTDFFYFMYRKEWGAMKQLVADDPATVALRDVEEGTPLIRLSIFDFSGPNADLINQLLRAGADVNAQAKDGTTALHNAAKNYQIAYLELLLAKGADPKTKIHDSIYPTTNGFTALHFLLSANGTRLEEVPVTQKITGLGLLLDHGADINAKDTAGASPLHLAAIGGEPEIVAALLEKGADPRSKNAAGQTPLVSIKALKDTPPVHRIRELLEKAASAPKK